MSILVTGTGFVGGYVVRDLVRAGHDVVCFDIAPNPDYLRALLGEGIDLPTMVRGDIADLAGLLRTMTEHGVERVVHLASLVTRPSEVDPALALRVNIQGTDNVFEAARILGLRKVVWASSIAVYGERSAAPDATISDQSPLDPPNLYGSCKALNERLTRSYHEQFGTNITGIRLSRVYGYGQHVKSRLGSGSSWVDNLVARPAYDSALLVVPFGEREFDFQYVEDASRAFTTAVMSELGGGTTYLTSGDHRTVREAFDFVRSLLPGAQMVLQDGGELRDGATDGWARRYDASLIRDELGYEGTIPMEQGLTRTLNRFRAESGLPLVGSGAIA